MKVTPDHLAILRDAIVPLDTDDTREKYRTGNIPRAGFVKDLNRRYRWDLLWASRAMDQIDGDYLDSHLDTALRSIVAPL